MLSFQHIPKLVYFIGVFLTLASLVAGKFFIETFFSMLILILLFALFYKESEPPVIIAAVSFQWLSISIGHFYLIFFDATHRDLLWRPIYSLQKIDETFWLSMYALLAFSVGLKLAIYRMKTTSVSFRLIHNYNTLKIITIYVLFSFAFESFTAFIRFRIPGLFQAMNTFTYFKWSLFFIMIYISFKKREYIQLVLSIVLIELILGFTAYFAEFKDFLILFPLVYLSFEKIKTRKQIIAIVIAAFLLINIGAIWSYVKIEYRMFLSGGERAQIVTVSKEEAIKKLWELSLNLDKKKYSLGFEALVKRIYFLEYFSATINHIPYFKPYMHGENLSKSLEHIFMPRILFPDKQPVDDSKQTFELTGIDVADASEGTSISTGYMAESYADFGPLGMHFFILFLGFSLGLIYRYFSTGAPNSLWSFALIFPMFFLLNINGISQIKIFGNTVYFFIIFLIIRKFILNWLDNWIRIAHEHPM